jgi:hypothetical protein
MRAPATVVILRPLDELAPAPERAARGERGRARRAVEAPLAGRADVTEMLDRAVGILRDHFALMVGLGALAWLPVRALQPFIGPHVWEQQGDPSTMMLGSSFGSLVSSAGSALSQCLASALLARIVHGELEGRPVAIWESLRFVLTRLHLVVCIALLTALATAAGTCACIVPGILLSWKLSVAPMACVIEGTGVRASLGRSMLLTRRGFWRWVFLSLCVFMIGLPFSGIGTLADWPGMRAQALAFTGLSGTAFDLVYALVSSLMLGAAVALHSSVLTVYYGDCRVRREGTDLEAQQARLSPAEAQA